MHPLLGSSNHHESSILPETGKYMGVSKNDGTPKSSILIEFSIINHPFWGTPILGNTHMIIYVNIHSSSIQLQVKSVKSMISTFLLERCRGPGLATG